MAKFKEDDKIRVTIDTAVVYGFAGHTVRQFLDLKPELVYRPEKSS